MQCMSLYNYGKGINCFQIHVDQTFNQVFISVFAEGVIIKRWLNVNTKAIFQHFYSKLEKNHH